MLKAKIYFGNLAKHIFARAAHLVRRRMPRVAAWATRCIGRQEQQQPSGREMITQRNVEKGSLL
jgi:hypothetical protein